MKTKEIIALYALAFWALLGYWVATIPRLTGENGWAFAQPLYILIPVLTAYYGTWFLFGAYLWERFV